MEFSVEQEDILVRAWLLAREGKGQVLEAWALPDAHRLSEAGWLERRMLDNGDASYWWTREAEAALDLNALTASVEGREN